jgi:hypothetical protein
MPKVSKATAPNVVSPGPFEDRSDDLDGHTVNFVALRADMDLAPLLRGLPDDRCPCPHWGYMLSGRMTVDYGDREEVFEAGDAFYLPPGHAPRAAAGSEFVQFSPTAELDVVQAAMRANMEALQAGG